MARLVLRSCPHCKTPFIRMGLENYRFGPPLIRCGYCGAQLKTGWRIPTQKDLIKDLALIWAAMIVLGGAMIYFYGRESVTVGAIMGAAMLSLAIYYSVRTIRLHRQAQKTLANRKGEIETLK